MKNKKMWKYPLRGCAASFSIFRFWIVSNLECEPRANPFRCTVGVKLHAMKSTVCPNVWRVQMLWINRLAIDDEKSATLELKCKCKCKYVCVCVMQRNNVWLWQRDPGGKLEWTPVDKNRTRFTAGNKRWSHNDVGSIDELISGEKKWWLNSH